MLQYAVRKLPDPLPSLSLNPFDRQCRTRPRPWYQVRECWVRSPVLALAPEAADPEREREPTEHDGVATVTSRSGVYGYVVRRPIPRLPPKTCCQVANKSFALYMIGGSGEALRAAGEELHRTVYTLWYFRMRHQGTNSLPDIYRECFAAAPIGILAPSPAANVQTTLLRVAREHLVLTECVRELEGQMEAFNYPDRRDYFVQERFRDRFLVVDVGQTTRKAWIVGREDELGDRMWERIESGEKFDRTCDSVTIGDEGNFWICASFSFERAVNLLLVDEELYIEKTQIGPRQWKDRFLPRGEE